MLDERAFIAQLEAAQADQFANMLTQPNAAEEKALRFHFGDKRYRRLRNMALKRRLSQNESPLGSVIVIHDILGSSLGAVNGDDQYEALWVNAAGIVGDDFERLRLADDGRTPFDSVHRRQHAIDNGRTPFGLAHDITATGMLKRHYGELLLSLSQRWEVHTFVYDWRKDLRIAADALNAAVTNWFDDEEKPVHIVAHGMGGLVARAFISNYLPRWEKCSGRLIMLGTPNYGSFMAPQIFMGVGALVNVLGNLYDAEKNADLVDILTSFPSLYQMLPIAFDSEAEDNKSATIINSLFHPSTYGDNNIVQSHITDARELYTTLSSHNLIHKAVNDSAINANAMDANAIDASRMICIVGYGQPTQVEINDINEFKKLKNIRDHKPSSAHDLSMFVTTNQGDGFVPCERAVLYAPGPNGNPKKDAPIGERYYVDETHGGLTSNKQVLAAIDELLERGSLHVTHAGRTSGRKNGDISDKLPETLNDQPVQSEKLDGTAHQLYNPDGGKVDLVGFVSRIKTRGAASLGSYVSYQERIIEENLTRNFLATDYDDERRPISHRPTFKTATISIVVAHGNIAMIPDDQVTDQDIPPIDAIAVGHYLGVMPQGAMRDLDISRSLALLGDSAARSLKKSDLLLTQLSERGTIRGDLGQPFFLPDPCQASFKAASGDQAPPQRVIAIAGMGVPGRFGEPELTVLARELCWALGRIGKRHVATVLIGTGRGNLSEEDAVSAWVRGIKHAITGLAEDAAHQLERVTFVELDPQKAARIERSVQAEAMKLRSKNRLFIGPGWRSEPQNIAPDQHAEQPPAGKLQEWEIQETAAERTLSDYPKQYMPTRVTVGCKNGIYHFGAITQDASIPERELRVDPKLIEQANNELAAEWDPQKQVERGRLLGALLVPQDLRTQLSSTAPVVVLLDATTARIHWEAVAQRILTNSEGSRLNDDQEQSEGEDGYFLGTTRGLTRQLRTTFSPPPEPPPPARRVLRVLVIADPAADAHLPGAQEEGVEVTELFESYNKIYTQPGANRIEVVSLIGPSDATRTTVMRELMLHSYDVLHFAGHCVYVENDTSQSGWVFSDGQLLTANELKRIDRVPKFIFSNACQSGITPDRSEERAPGLAPSFAEGFFQQGVTNFVCTAWPINDAAARTFAIELYSRLIGIQPKIGGIGFQERAETQDSPKYMYMYQAMQQARQSIRETDSGIRTWGAYQHYGNPYLQLFSWEENPDEN